MSRVFSQVSSRQQLKIYSVTLSKLYRRDELMPTYDDSRVKSQPEHSCRGKGMGRSAKQDEWICLEAEESGTMRGPLHGPGGRTIPPTNKSFKIPSTIVCRVVNGKINEVRVYYDVLGLMAQLGLGP